jgi:hypothetical protein
MNEKITSTIVPQTPLTGERVRIPDVQYFHQQRPGLHSGHVLSPGCPPIANAVGGQSGNRITGLGGPAGGQVRPSDFLGKAGVNSRGLFSKQ